MSTPPPRLPLRARLRAALGRTSHQRIWAQRLVVTTAAVAVSWSIGSLFNGADALIASILTVITLRTSLQATVSEGFGQILGVSLGIFVAFGAWSVLGSGTAPIAVTVAAAIVLARILRLGDDGAINIAVTALIVLGPGTPTAAAIDRVWGTAIGVVVGVLFSFFAHPSTPVGRTQDLLSSLASDTANLLDQISSGVADGYTTDDAAGWLERSRELADRTGPIRAQAEEAVRYSRWFPTASREEADTVFARFVAMEHTIIQVRTIARTLFDASTRGVEFTDTFNETVADVLAAAGDAVENKAVVVGDDPLGEIDTAVVSAVRDISADAIEVVRSIDDTQEILIGAALLANVERIADSLEIDNPAIAEVPTPMISVTPAETIGQVLRNAPLTDRRKRRRRQP